MIQKYFGEITFVNLKDMYVLITPDLDSRLDKELDPAWPELYKCKDVYYKFKENEDLKKFYQVSFYIEEKDGKKYAYNVQACACYCNDLFCTGPKTCDIMPYDMYLDSV